MPSSIWLCMKRVGRQPLI